MRLKERARGSNNKAIVVKLTDKDFHLYTYYSWDRHIPWHVWLPGELSPVRFAYWDNAIRYAHSAMPGKDGKINDWSRINL
jgi:hypothetical protein